MIHEIVVETVKSSDQVLNAGPSIEASKTLNDIESIGDYLGMFGADLIRRLNDEYVPVHHPGTDEPLEIFNRFKRPLFTSQSHVVTALIKGLRRERNLFLIGEPGTGKTAMSIATFFALLHDTLGGRGRVIYMVPNHLINKTKREIGLLVEKSMFEVQFLNDYTDVIRLRDSGKMDRKPQKIEVYIIARDTAKLGYIFEPAALWVERSYNKSTIYNDDVQVDKKTVFQGWVCPDCGGQLMKEEEGSMVPMDISDFSNKHGKPTRRTYNLACSNQIRLYRNTDPEKDEYRTCGARLWAAKNKDKSSFSGKSRRLSGPAPRKVSPADLFKRYFKHKFDLAIGDEVHELTGGSAQAHAFHVLIKCAKKAIAMTGTLMNGYASNLFELIFRMFPRRMKEMGFSWGEVGKWIDLYGVRERITKIKKDTSLNRSSNGAVSKTSTKELPAAAPQLFTDMLSDVSCFIQMSDMFEILPKLQEGPMNVSLEGERRFVSCVTKIERRAGRTKRKGARALRLVAPSWYLKNNLERVTGLLRKAVEEELVNGQTVLLGSLLNTLLSYPDVPFNFKGVYHPDTGKEIVSPDFRLSDRVIYPKELQLIKFVRARLRAGRKVGIYATYTGELATLQRIQRLLEERGIKTAVLESNVDGPKREEWIAEREKEGIQVLLTNPILVSTGLDLLSFPSLYFYQTGYRLSIVRQASRRHWRIGQQEVCETVYSGYKDTMQELAINLMAAKMSAALALEGQFSQEGLAALTEGSGGSLATELAKRFVGNKVEGVESAESIWGKMTLDTTEFISKASAAENELIYKEVLRANEIMDVGTVLDKSEEQVEPASPIRHYIGQSLEHILLDWALETIPSDLHGRFEQQLSYVVQNLQKGMDGFTVTRETLLGDYHLVWDPRVAPTEPAEYRRWIYTLTNKPLEERTIGDWKSELRVEGKKPQTKTKRIYKVSEGQIAFIF
ncbi:DEAD/DEAH box helicase [Paenibacillus sp. NPDC056579]|uniref:DEAD/DEAH box helicase n=1 Tax=Paenibacillus sp. NPDC056579 TaxID=3345871 RepID=UPI0036C6A562